LGTGVLGGILPDRLAGNMGSGVSMATRGEREIILLV
jgi:hypothetical protein